jgi:hypothetical protein
VLRSLRCSLLILGCLAIFHSTLLYGQTGAPGVAGPIVFQTSAQNVVVDVVVTGRNGQPVEGLHKGDFLLFEDGHPQTITSSRSILAANLSKRRCLNCRRIFSLTLLE